MSNLPKGATMKTLILLGLFSCISLADKKPIFQSILTKEDFQVTAEIGMKQNHALVIVKKHYRHGYGAGIRKDAQFIIEGLTFNEDTREITYNETVCGKVESVRDFGLYSWRDSYKYKDYKTCEFEVVMNKTEMTYEVFFE